MSFSVIPLAPPWTGCHWLLMLFSVERMPLAPHAVFTNRVPLAPHVVFTEQDAFGSS